MFILFSATGLALTIISADVYSKVFCIKLDNKFFFFLSNSIYVSV